MKVQDILDLIEFLDSYKWELKEKGEKKNGYVDEERIERCNKLIELLKGLIAQTVIV